jgi:REP element-mobilizing transposase RayT
MKADQHRKLPRLSADFYRGHAYVHWTMTIHERAIGWLIPEFHYKFREILTHATFRYSFACPIYCLMPDHMHLLWIGIHGQSDQLKAMEYFRKQVGIPLKEKGCEFQHQSYDHVLRNDEMLESAVCDLVEYIARNPERKGLVCIDGYKNYPFSNCLVPGYPELQLWQPEFWQRFWRSYFFLQKNGLSRLAKERSGEGLLPES